jgi:hypothetical protein
MAPPNPITIQQCTVNPPKPLSKVPSGTQIVFVNTGPKTATSITFAVGYRNAESDYFRRVTDSGTFVPNSVVDHHYTLYSDVTYAGKTTHGCQAISVQWSDGTRWDAPEVPQMMTTPS